LTRILVLSVVLTALLLGASGVAVDVAPADGPHLATRPGAGALGAAQVARDERRGVPRLRAPDGVRQLSTDYVGEPPLARGDFFPVAVWFESVIGEEDIRADRSVGLNTYLELTTNTDLDLVARSGMRMVSSVSATDERLDGFLLPDEVDMWAGPGDAEWTGNSPGQGPICRPEESPCGYTVLADVMAGVPPERYAHGQFGKGVAIWESDDEARRFVNTYPDAVSASLYWSTDPNICGPSEGGAFLGIEGEVSPSRCRAPRNYGLTVDRLRNLVQPRGRTPVWVFVEVGHPFGEDDAPTITPLQLEQAVWSGLVHGARGVVYFNHNFGGPCFSFHVLRDACGDLIRPTVARVNTTIRRRARLLNAPFVDGLARTHGGVDVAVKLHRGHFRLIVAHRTAGDAVARIHIRCGNPDTAVDLKTGQRLGLHRRVLRVRLPQSRAVRFLRLDGGHTCGL
jgi:hypothetical protein